jgi:hypothetical protein
MRGSPGSALLLWLALGCHHSAPPVQPAAPKTRLEVLPAESDRFPKAAAAVSQSLADATVTGMDEKQLSKVSLEVVQLSIECVDETTECYAAVGKSLHANKMLFAQLSAEKKQLKMTVTLFDVDASAPARTVEKVFANEAEASAGAASLVAEATKP